MENKEKIKLSNKFDDLSECTEYYLEELGKIDSFANESNDLTRKEKKKLHNYITFFFFEDLETLKNKAKSNKMVDKTEISEFNKEFKEQHSSSFKSIIKGMVSIPRVILRGTKNAMRLIIKGRKEANIDIITDAAPQIDNVSNKLIEHNQSDENDEHIEDLTLSAPDDTFNKGV